MHVKLILKLYNFCPPYLRLCFHHLVSILSVLYLLLLSFALANIAGGRQSRGVKNPIKEGITIDHVNNISVNNSNVIISVI